MGHSKQHGSDLVDRIKDSVWAPVLAKASGVVLALATLGLVGSGALDRFVSTPAALAAAHKPKPPATAASAAEAPMQGAAAPASATSPPSGATSASASASAAAPSPPAVTKDGKVILNLATVADLEKLPGVGKKKAAAILALRDKLGGRFKSLGELARVRGIKRKFIERIKDKVVLDAPKDEGAPGPSR
ncbi:MAG TPA: helix-hairpin-helix domain-containing protein [Polyangiaceae bacterium]|nr:helix-hairpin-helix domain-containing protein [Polyangiaceae bacterium]